jgi:hypothetical protein
MREEPMDKEKMSSKSTAGCWTIRMKIKMLEYLKYFVEQ